MIYNSFYAADLYNPPAGRQTKDKTPRLTNVTAVKYIRRSAALYNLVRVGCHLHRVIKINGDVKGYAGVLQVTSDLVIVARREAVIGGGKSTLQ